MDIWNVINAALALVFVLGLVGVTSFLLRRYGGGRRLWFSRVQRGEDPRLVISDMVMLDAKHRLVLVKRDAVEHLVLLGPEQATVIESGIKGMPSSKSRKPKKSIT